MDDTFQRLGVTPLVLADVHQTFLAGQVACLRTPLNKTIEVSNSMKAPCQRLRTHFE